MARVVLPESRLRARRKRRRARLTLVLAGLVVVLLAAVVGLSYLPFLQVRDVAIVGTQTLATSTLEDYVQAQIAGRYWFVFPRRNIFLYPKQSIREGLLAHFPELRSADVHAANFHTIAATIVEREPKALWCTGDVCYFMDQGGVVYAGNSGAQGLVSYRGAALGNVLPKQYLTPGQFESLFALVDALSQKIEPITSVSVDNNNDVEATFGSGFVLKFALDDAQGDVFERFSLALTSDPFKNKQLSNFAYLDLRFGDKLYYKLK
ncbi:MAG TPA: cell division protein FtsQ/DivIB [Candidatus Paceibacterota bacterium]|jgi:cell division septal protein FtsQ|nr:cell division protein FtsQ/DivIB [Candidatus Paceibacterota bacterium]